jgi:hypothetical protein
MKKIITLATAISFSLALSSCSLTPPKKMMDVQAGEKFHLTESLTIEPRDGRAFIQFGKQIKKSDLDRYDQFCSIEVKSLESKTEVIKPEVFTITKVRLDVQEVVSAPSSAHKMLAAYEGNTLTDAATPAESLLIASSGNDGGGPAATYDMVYFYLDSPSKQNVYRLTCSGSLSDGDAADRPRSYRPQRAQANKIMGKVGFIKP